MEVDLTSWPSVPEPDRPKKLYVDESVTNVLRQELDLKGWIVCDVRLLTGAESVRGTLEGVRLKSIKPPLGPNWLKSVELEAKTYKLLSDKGAAPDDASKRVLQTEEDVDTLLSFGREDVPSVVTSPEPLAILPENRRGRRKGSKDSKPRKSTGEARGIALQKKLEKQEREASATRAPEVV